jgi:adenosylcobinamide-GDP ribazoletransferase
MKNEIKIFFTALMFYTRIPCPKNIDHHPEVG